MQLEQKKCVAHRPSLSAPQVLGELNQHGSVAAVGSVRLVVLGHAREDVLHVDLAVDVVVAVEMMEKINKKWTKYYCS